MLHPFYATTPDEAMDMERQALGRIDRIGQKASSVVVWRVVTAGTVEETIYSEACKASRKRPRE